MSGDNSINSLNQNLSALIAEEDYWLANLANASALLYNQLDDINWAGFYLLKGRELVLGPFQGKPACVRIKVGKGVCGTAVAEDRICLVPDVHKFPGHIACDPASRSEIVVPIRIDSKIVGVLDIDSPQLNRFGENERKVLEEFVEILQSETDFTEFRDCFQE